MAVSILSRPSGAHPSPLLLHGSWCTDGFVRVRFVDKWQATGVNVHDARGRVVALVFAGFGDGPATARLISQAPAMVAALQRALRLLQTFPGHCGDRAAAQVREVLEAAGYAEESRS